MKAKIKILFVGLTAVDVLNVCQSYPKEDSDSRVSYQLVAKGGNASNAACVLAQHSNFDVELLTCLSGLDEQSFVISEIKRNNVTIHEGSSYCSYKFPYSSCIINEKNGSRTILHYRDANFPELTVEDFRKVDLSVYDWIHFEGRNLNMVEKMLDIVLQFRAQSPKSIIISGEVEKPVRMNHLFDVMLSRVDILFVSKDIAKAKGFATSEACVKELSNHHDLKGRIVICPWGEQGASGIEKTDDSWNYFHSLAQPIEKAVDTLGAGDTFIAGVIYCLATGENLETSLKYGCKIAGQKCTQYGMGNLIDKPTTNGC